MTPLVEAGRDGRLGDREEASLDRHLVTCAACRSLARELDEVRVLLRRPAGSAPTPLEHQRGRLALLRAAATPPAPPIAAPRPRWLRPVAAVVTAAAVAASAMAPRRPSPAAVPVAQHLPSLRPLPAPEAAPLRSYPSETTVRGSATARFERRSADQVERVALAEGTLDLAVRKLGPGERFLVSTDDAEVEVRGTVFQVEAHAGHVARVAVSEGKVEVRYHDAVSMVAAGGEWQPPREPVATGETPKPPAPAPPEPRRTPAASRAVASRLPPPRPEPDRDASRTFGDAVDLLGRGDYAAARSRLDAFRAAHPADGRADLAAFLTIVSLQRAGRRAEAQEAAHRYLELYPEGDRRADVVRVANGR